MHTAFKYLNDLQKLYDLIVFLQAAGNAKKVRCHLVRLTKNCYHPVSSHVKYESDLLLTRHIWPAKLL
jgi:hypothetical protein